MVLRGEESFAGEAELQRQTLVHHEPSELLADRPRIDEMCAPFVV